MSSRGFGEDLRDVDEMLRRGLVDMVCLRAALQANCRNCASPRWRSDPQDCGRALLLQGPGGVAVAVAYRPIRIENSARGTVVVERGRMAGSIIQRTFGLHLLPRLRSGEGLLLPGATTIDTMFMRYPIDLVFLDRERRVTRIVHDMRPWRMVWSADGGRDCLELPAGAAAASGTQVGDQLTFEDIAE